MSDAATAERPAAIPGVVVRRQGRVDYQQCYDAMRRHTAERTASSVDEIWLVEHAPVYTLGQAGKPEHLLRPTDIAVLRIDRGGQITYHGPGQVVAYTLLDLRRRDLSVKGLVSRLEQAVIDLLFGFEIRGERRPGAPGVYVNDAKIAALGLRVRNGRCYHGLALNVKMDLTPFDSINPCGYERLQVTQLADLGVRSTADEVAALLGDHIVAQLAPVKLHAPHADSQR